MKLLIISGHDVLGEILRRNAQRDHLAPGWLGELGFTDSELRVAAKRQRVHVARLGDGELVESNLPLPQSKFENRKSKMPV